MTRKMAMMAAMLGLCLGTAPAEAVPIEGCKATEYGWLKNFEIGMLDPASGDFVDTFARSENRPAILTESARLMEDVLHHAALFYRATLHLTAPPKLQCVADPDSGEMRVAIIIDPALANDSLGEYRLLNPVLRGFPDIRLSTQVTDVCGRPAGCKHFLQTDF